MSWSGFVGDTLYLDTNIFILAVERGNPWSKMLRELFEAIDQRAVDVFTSELTIAEVLAKPLSLGENDLANKYDKLLSANSIVKVFPIDRAILWSAAALQGRLAIKLMDAIHLATAKASACNFFLTCDQRLGAKIEEELRWLSLDKVGSHGSKD